MATPTRRLAERVRRDFEQAHAEVVLEELSTIPESLPLGGQQDAERMQAALVIPARGDLNAFAELMAMARADWRDLLVGAGLGDSDWPAHLDRQLGPV